MKWWQLSASYLTWRWRNEYKDQATSIFSEIADIIESSDNAENNIYDIVDFMIGIMTKDQLNQVEDMITNQYPEEAE